MSPKTLIYVKNWCSYENNCVHILFLIVFTVSSIYLSVFDWLIWHCASFKGIFKGYKKLVLVSLRTGHSHGQSLTSLFWYYELVVFVMTLLLTFPHSFSLYTLCMLLPHAYFLFTFLFPSTDFLFFHAQPSSGKREIA